jgi:hypothetical protein
MESIMRSDERTAYVTRDAIMKLLSDAEVGSVSTAETEAAFSPGDEYLDLEGLEHGVQRAGGTPVPIGRALPRQAVHAETWTKILALLAPPQKSK